LKAFGAMELREGRIPAFNPVWGLGQPFRGNPNALPYYPGNIFYLILPFWSAFNLHYALHWLIALLTMTALARGLGQGPAGSLTAGITYAGSGWMLSALTYYNLLAVAAWWPLAMLGAVRGGRRGIALGGLACGLALLGGEPVAAALGLVPLLLAAVSRHGWRRGIATAVAIGAVGVLLALPQIVAFARALPFTYRGSHGMTAKQAAFYTLHPLRVLELLVPFPFGRPGWLGRYGIWAGDVLPHMPLFLTLYSGTVAIWLAASAAARRRPWALLALAGLVLAAATGISGEWLVRASFGLFRFPEKLLFWFALAVPLLAGWGIEEIAERRGWRRAAVWAGGAMAVLAALGAAVLPFLLSAVTRALPADRRDAAVGIVQTQGWAWVAGLLIGGGALLLAAWAARRGRLAVVVALQLAVLVQLYPAALTDDAAPYRKQAAWKGLVPEGAAVVNSSLAVPEWFPDPRYQLPPGPRAVLERQKVENLDPVPGVLQGLTYPLAPDLEGMGSPLFTPLLSALPRLSWPERARWFRLLGTDAAILYLDVQVPELRRAATAERRGVLTRLYRGVDPAPPVWWPRQVVVAPTPADAVRTVSALPDPVAVVSAPRAVAHDPAGRVRLISASPDRIELEVEGNGGLAVVRRAYQPLLVARSGGRTLPTLPADLCLLGVEVPPGRHRVVLEVSSRPEWIAAGVALLALLGVGLALRKD
jgi:hypothetical protein